MGDGACVGDNRFEVIAAAKKKIIDCTNIESSPDEMKVLDNFLFRCWQMGWLKSIEEDIESNMETIPADGGKTENNNSIPAELDESESAMMKFARSELKRLENACDTDDAREMQRYMNECILDLLYFFSKQGHSGFSANYAINLFHELADWRPLTALSGEDDEWMDISYMTRDGKQTEQNKRCAGLFRDNHDNSTAHYIDDVIFSDNGGATWFSSNWMKEKGNYGLKITFPWVPPTEPRKVYIKYVGEIAEDGTSDEFEDITGNEEEIKRLRDAWEAELEMKPVDH